jgi:peptidoglycan/xylan/chitin deacetylase (PgdA/CDA1 family)
MKNLIMKASALGGLLLAVLVGGVIYLPTVHALPSTVTPTARVTFTFDDGYTSAIEKAAPTLAAHGFKGTSYVITNKVGKRGYMTWPQLTTLQNTHNWEIGSHSVSHPLMTTLTAAQLEQQVSQSKATLLSHGFNATTFATPYGDYDNNVLAAVAKYYAAHRPFADVENQNIWPYNDYLLYVKQVQVGVSVDQVKAYIDEAKQHNAWLILVFHEIADVPSPDPDEYEYATADLNQIASYVQAQNLPVVTMRDGLVNGTNVMPNATFDNGIADGWSTDTPTKIKKNTASKGSYPSPTNSIELNATTKAAHLFAPKLDVDPTKQYAIKTFLNVQTLTSGEVTFYIDEYDEAGNWISGQYKGGERSVFVESANLTYTPTSAAVKKASLQIAISPNSGIKAFVDNVQWFSLP